MKKKILSAAILVASGIGSVQAVNLSQDGTGEVLIFPYYTTNGGHKTLLSVVNTTEETKAVKVRFREGMNSREVLDFNLYLSPEDVWVGTVSDVNGTPTLTTGDKSCTVPMIGAGKEFVSYAYDNDHADAVTGQRMTSTNVEYDGGPTTIDRAAEGYVEMIEMGIEDTLDPNWALVWDKAGAAGDGKTDSTHAAGTPNDCAGLVSSWTVGAGGWQDRGANVAMNAPTGGLFGMGAVINVATGTEMAVVPTALAAFKNAPDHRSPGSSLPTLANATPAQSVVVMNDGVSQGVRVYQDIWANGEDSVSAVLQARAIMNQFTINPDVNAETSWIVTFPTKHYYADSVPNPTALSVRDARAPFVNDFTDTSGVTKDDKVENGKACEAAERAYVDREEGTPIATVDGPGFSPQPIQSVTPYSLCNEVNVVNFGASDVFSSTYLSNTFELEAGFDKGWGALYFVDGADGFGHAGHNLINTVANSVVPSDRAYQGLPVIGFRVTRLGNADVGVGAAYDVADAHKYQRAVGVVADVTNGATAGAFAYTAVPAGSTSFDQALPAENCPDVTNPLCSAM